MENQFSLSSTTIPSRYYDLLVAAYIRGKLSTAKPSETYFAKPLEDLIPEEIHDLFQLAEEHVISINFLERQEPPQYLEKLFAVLRGIQPDQVVNIENGKTDFVWQLVNEFHYLPVIALSTDDEQVEQIKAIHRGGFSTLSTKKDIPFPLLQGFPTNQFDVVTSTDSFASQEQLLEFLPELARITKRFIITTFPNSFTEMKIRDVLKEQNVLQFRVEKTDDFCILIGRK